MSDSKGKPYWRIECTTCGNQFTAYPIEIPETPKTWLVVIHGLGRTFSFVTKCVEGAIGAQVEEVWLEIDELPDTVEGWEYEEVPERLEVGGYVAIYG